MRWSRLAIVSVLLSLVLLGAGLTVAASGSRSSAHRVRPQALTLQAALRAQLKQLTAPRPLPVPGTRARAIPLPGDLPHAGTCFVRGGPCSATPCIEFAHVTSATATAGTDAPVVLKSAVAVARSPVTIARGAVAVAPVPLTVAPVASTVASRIVTVSPGGPSSGCHAPPKILRVSGP